MHRALPLLLLTAGLVALGGALRFVAPTSHASAISNCDVSHAALDADEQELLTLINEYRVSQGRSPLVASPSLNRAAAWMSEDVASTGWAAQVLSPHNDSLGRNPFDRMPDCGYPNSGRSENLALFSNYAAGVLAGWKGSPGHNANLLDPGAVAIGIGFYGNIWTLDFGSIDDSNAPQPTTTAAPSPSPTATATATPSPTPTATPVLTPVPGRVFIPLVVIE